jgi:hypothetical protein
MYQSKEVAEQIQIFLSSPAEDARNSAHSYLLGFQSSSEAWGICRELMVPSTPQVVLILLSQIFYKKLQNEFQTLSVAEREELKTYLFNLVLENFSCSSMFKKICQSVALVGIIGINSFWEDFMIDTLRIPKLEVMLEIIDCIPFCLEEFIFSKKTVEMVKTKIRENIDSIMECLYITLNEKGYITQILDILKNWKIVTLPILSHVGLFKELVKYMTKVDQNFPLICEAFISSISSTPYSQLLQQSRYLGSSQAYINKIPPLELSHLVTLMQLLSDLPYLNSADPSTQKWGSEFLISFCTNFMFFLLEPVKLWEKIQEITGNNNLSVCMVGIEFYYSLKEVLVVIETLPVHIYEWLLLCVKALAIRCSFNSHQYFFKALSQKSEDEDIGFMQFRISAEDVFYAVYLIFNKHHPEKGRGFIKELGGLLAQPNEFNLEVFIFMMRSMFLGISEYREWELLQEVRYN